MENEVIEKLGGYLDKNRVFYRTKEAAIKANNMQDKIENNHSVPKKLWDKFGYKGQIMYNNIISQSKMEFMSHPKAKISIEEWETIRHNFATIAAFELKSLTK